MKVVLTHEEVLEACKEWVERHYGIAVQGTPDMIVTLSNESTARVYPVHRASLTFPDAPKPDGGPYRAQG